MSTNWPLLKEVEKNNTLNYDIYRCIEPTAKTTGKPWFPYENICQCDPKDSNPTGRGFTSCTFGVNEQKDFYPFGQFKSPSNISSPQGALFPNSSGVLETSPPQLQPRQMTRIGNAWRSGN